MRVDLTIDELWLVGFDEPDRDRLGSGIENALAQALTPQAIQPFMRGGPASSPRSGGPNRSASAIAPRQDVDQIASSIVAAAGRAHATRGSR
jgi:hypothetical protein